MNADGWGAVSCLDDDGRTCWLDVVDSSGRCHRVKMTFPDDFAEDFVPDIDADVPAPISLPSIPVRRYLAP
jgi:hypothetical protein